MLLKIRSFQTIPLAKSIIFWKKYEISYESLCIRTNISRITRTWFLFSFCVIFSVVYHLSRGIVVLFEYKKRNFCIKSCIFDLYAPIIFSRISRIYAVLSAKVYELFQGEEMLQRFQGLVLWKWWMKNRFF